MPYYVNGRKATEVHLTSSEYYFFLINKSGVAHKNGCYSATSTRTGSAVQAALRFAGNLPSGTEWHRAVQKIINACPGFTPFIGKAKFAIWSATDEGRFLVIEMAKDTGNSHLLVAERP